MTTPPFSRFSRPASERFRVLSNPAGPDLAPGSQGVSQARLSIVGGRPRLVLSGADPATRALVREELERGEPEVLVLEALDAWELLQLAPRATMVVLAGDLPDATASAMVRVLAHRHPDLNVISLAGTPADPATAR